MDAALVGLAGGDPPHSRSPNASSDRDINGQPRSYEEVVRHTTIVEYEIVESESASIVDSDQERLLVADRIGKSPSKSKMGKGWNQLKLLIGPPLGFGTAYRGKEEKKG